jgi:hypothetical protein
MLCFNKGNSHYNWAGFFKLVTGFFMVSGGLFLIAQSFCCTILKDTNAGLKLRLALVSIVVLSALINPIWTICDVVRLSTGYFPDGNGMPLNPWL